MKIIPLDANGQPVEQPPANAIKTVIDMEARTYTVYEEGDELPEEVAPQ